MNLRYLFILCTASLLIPVCSMIAFGETQSTPTGIKSESPNNQFPPCPPPPRFEGQQNGNLKPSQPGNQEPPWAGNLNLSNVQRDRIKIVHEQGIKDIEEIHKKLREADLQMRSLLADDTTVEKLRQQHEQIQKIHQQLDNKHFEMMLAERQVLTAEQRQQLGKLPPKH